MPERRVCSRWVHRLCWMLLCVLPATGCRSTLWQARFGSRVQDIPDGPNAEAPFLKLHTAGGDVYVFESWRIDEAEQSDLEQNDAAPAESDAVENAGVRVIGVGVRYDAGRALVDQGLLAVPIDRIVLVETNRPELVREEQFALLGVVSVAQLVGTVFCIANPKACFGSCPTFYTYESSGFEDPLRPGPSGRIQAEAFSASVAPALEERDVDVLEDVRSENGHVRLVMRNEALETHALRGIELIGVEKEEGWDVFRHSDDFYLSSSTWEPLFCQVGDADCLEAVHAPDGKEYLSETDGADLTTREVMEVRFPARQGPLGLVISARNSLLNTFVFYQFMAWLGDDAGRWFARLESAPSAQRDYLRRLTTLFGDIVVSVRDSSGEWVEIGRYDELGPIARETQVIPIPDGLVDGSGDSGELSVRLEMARGHWKLDRVALASLDAPVQPTHYALSSLASTHGRGDDERAFRRLLDPDDWLFTYPGDEFVLDFRVPDDGRARAFFLATRGYYYEWMRDEWISEQDPAHALAFLLNPEAGLRLLAPKYKKVEHEMEAAFWRTRIREEE